MIGESWALGGRTNRNTESPSCISCRTASPGSCRNCAATGSAPLATRRVVSSTHSTLSRTMSSAKDSDEMCSPRGARGIGPRSNPSGLRSTRAAPSWIAPWPSATAWCNLVITAAWPSGRPSSTVTFHSGRSRSKSDILWRRHSSNTSCHVEPAGIRKRRRWNDRSKSGSITSRGLAHGTGPSTMRCRRIGTCRLARSYRSTRRSQSGSHSRISSPSMVDRMIGSSLAARQVAKSQPDKRTGSSRSSVMTVGSPRSGARGVAGPV